MCDVLNPMDFGAVGNDLADDTPAFLVIAAELLSRGGGACYIPIPPVKYKLTAPIVWPGNVRIFGDDMHGTKIHAAHNGVVFDFLTDEFEIGNLSIVGPHNPTAFGSIGIRAMTRLEGSNHVGAFNYLVKRMLVQGCFIGFDFGGAANAIVDDIQVTNCYGLGLRSLGAQGKWSKINIATCFLGGIEIRDNPVPELTMASPLLTDVETFANGGYGIKVYGNAGLLLKGAFLNNDSKGEIWFAPNAGAQLGYVDGAVIQFAGNNPFDPGDDPTHWAAGDKNAPGILIATGTAAPVQISKIATLGNAGIDISNFNGNVILSDSYLTGSGSGRRAIGAHSAVSASAGNSFSFYSAPNCGGNQISNTFANCGVKIGGAANILTGNHLTANSAAVAALELTATCAANVLTGNRLYQNNAAGHSFVSVPGSTYYLAANSALGGTVSASGAKVVSEL